MKKIYSVLVIFLLVSFVLGGTASAETIGMFTDGSTGRATANMTYYSLQNPSNPWSSITDVAFAAMDTATLLANYDILVMPWYVNSTNNLDWNTVIAPYLAGGGSILWEDPNNTGDLSGSGITFGFPSPGYTTDISLVAPFDSNGAAGYYHIHYGITAASADWDVWSTDGGGRIHGIYGEFGTNGGRMLLGVCDNLFHPVMSAAYDADHYNLLVNELNWLGSGSVDIPLGTVPEPATMLLLGAGLVGLAGIRKKKFSA